MQVRSRQRGVSLIEVLVDDDAGDGSLHERMRPSGSFVSGVSSDGARRIRSVPIATFRHGRGFSLVELLITLAIAVVLIVIAVPSFKSLTLSSKLTTTANEFVGAINVARMEAIKRNAKTQFCSNSTTANTTSDLLGTKCGTNTGAVYTLAGASTVSLVRDAVVGISTPLQISSAGVVALRFGGDGLAHDPHASDPSVAFGSQVVDICTSSMKANNHRLISMVGGSMLAVTSSTNATCP